MVWSTLVVVDYDSSMREHFFVTSRLDYVHFNCPTLHGQCVIVSSATPDHQLVRGDEIVLELCGPAGRGTDRHTTMLFSCHCGVRTLENSVGFEVIWTVSLHDAGAYEMM